MGSILNYTSVRLSVVSGLFWVYAEKHHQNWRRCWGNLKSMRQEQNKQQGCFCLFCHFWVFEFFFQFQLFRKLIEVILGIWEVVSLENSMWFGFYALLFISVNFLVKFCFSRFCLFLFGFFVYKASLRYSWVVRSPLS